MTEQPISKVELLDRIQRGWDDFNTYLSTLTEAQLTKPTDAAGWTAKDHITHLAIWEEGIYALLQRQDRVAAMGLDKETFESGDYDRMNAIIQQRYQGISLDEAMRMFRDTHRNLVGKVQSLSDEDLRRTYGDYSADPTATRPVMNVIMGNTYEHYSEHLPWIAAIAG